MNTQTDMSQKVQLVYSEEAQRAIEIGRKHHYRFRVVGYGDVPEKPFHQGAWWFEPVDVPQAGKAILELLRDLTVAYKGIVIAHEVSLVVTEPETVEEAPAKVEKAPEKKEDSKTPPIVSDSSGVAEGIDKAIGAVVPILLSAFVGMALLFVTALLRDPAVIVILDDGTWLEVCNYYE